jgi:hypothetical protein
MIVASPMVNWTGTILVSGTNTLTLNQVSLNPDSTTAALSSSGLPAFAGGLDLRNGILTVVSAIGVFSAQVLAVSNTGSALGGLGLGIVQVNSPLAISGTVQFNTNAALRSSATVTVNSGGLLEARSNAQIGPTATITGAGTLALNGCIVRSPTTLSITTITGPSTVSTVTTFMVNAQAQTVPVLTGWVGTVAVNSTGAPQTLTLSSPTFTATSRLEIGAPNVVISATTTAQGTITSVLTGAFPSNLTFTSGTSTGSLVFGPTASAGLAMYGSFTTGSTSTVALQSGVRLFGSVSVAAGTTSFDVNSGAVVMGTAVVTANAPARFNTGSLIQANAAVGNGGAGPVRLDGTTLISPVALSATVIGTSDPFAPSICVSLTDILLLRVLLVVCSRSGCGYHHHLHAQRVHANCAHSDWLGRAAVGGWLRLDAVSVAEQQRSVSYNVCRHRLCAVSECRLLWPFVGQFGRLF